MRRSGWKWSSRETSLKGKGLARASPFGFHANLLFRTSFTLSSEYQVDRIRPPNLFVGFGGEASWNQRALLWFLGVGLDRFWAEGVRWNFRGTFRLCPSPRVPRRCLVWQRVVPRHKARSRSGYGRAFGGAVFEGSGPGLVWGEFQPAAVVPCGEPSVALADRGNCAVPPGLSYFLRAFPALKCWAISALRLRRGSHPIRDEAADKGGAPGRAAKGNRRSLAPLAPSRCDGAPKARHSG